jgi:hypothetical protein
LDGGKGALSHFKEGQIVRCFNAGPNQSIKNGKLYKVTGNRDSHMVKIIPLAGGWDGPASKIHPKQSRDYYEKRFEAIVS